MFNLTTFKDVRELQNQHPQYKNLQTVMIVPRGMTHEGVIKQLEKSTKASGELFWIGNIIWKPAEKSQPLCACFKFIGDNPMCPRHGAAVAHG